MNRCFKKHKYLSSLWKVWVQKRQLKRWQKSYQIKQKQKTFDTLFTGENGFVLSKTARKDNDDLSLTYGEIDFLGFLLTLNKVKPKPTDVFFDLGSGLGKAVVATCLVYGCQKCVGIELLETLHQKACQIRSRLPQSDHQRMSFELGNFLESDLSEANIVFCSATAFFGDYWQAIQTKFLSLASNTKLVLVSKPLTITGFQLLEETVMPTSWGASPVYIYIRSQKLG